MLGHVEPLHIASIINCIPQCYHRQASLSRGPLKAMKRSNIEVREGRTSTVLKPENQLPITPLRKALTPRVRPTEYNRSYSVVL
ncbi:hypothetical protein ANTQUA_LOCUS5706 [Anthophora quadrimaculata]